MTGGQHQTILQDATDVKSVSFIILTQEKQRLRTFQKGIAVLE